MSPAWRKSNRSTNQGGECVEVAALADAIGIRDSKNPAGGHLVVRPTAFAALIQQIKADHLDPR